MEIHPQAPSKLFPVPWVLGPQRTGGPGRQSFSVPEALMGQDGAGAWAPSSPSPGRRQERLSILMLIRQSSPSPAREPGTRSTATPPLSLAVVSSHPDALRQGLGRAGGSREALLSRDKGPAPVKRQREGGGRARRGSRAPDPAPALSPKSRTRQPVKPGKRWPGSDVLCLHHLPWNYG